MSRSTLNATRLRDSFAPKLYSPKLLRLVPQVRWVCLLLVLAAPAVYTALSQDIGALAWDAATEHIFRAAVFSQAITDGVLYPRWVQALHLGLGSPLFTFQPPLPYYALDVLYRLGLPHHLGWRVLVAAGLLAASVGCYLLVMALTRRKWAATLAALAYLYAPYVLRNSMERGSNEMFSMFLYPWVLWGLIRLARNPSRGRFVGATLLWAACIGSHVLGPLMLAPFAGLLALFLAWRHRTVAPLAALVVGGLLMAWIWLPMGFEQAWVHVERDFTTAEALPADNAITLSSLLAPPAIYDVARANNGSEDRIGLVHTALLALGVPAALYAWMRRRRSLALSLAAAVVAGALLLWLFTPSADAVWRHGAPILGRLLYRSRLMGVQALAVAMVAGLALVILPLRWQRHVSLFACLALLLSAFPSLYVDLLHKRADFAGSVDLAQVRAAEITTDGSALTAFGEFTPRSHDGTFTKAFMDSIGGIRDAQTDPLVNPPAGVTVQSVEIHDTTWRLATTVRAPSLLTLYLLYYPRWQAYLDGEAVPLFAEAATGLAQLQLPAGTHEVVLQYGTTVEEQVGIWLSILTLLGLVAMVSFRLPLGIAADRNSSGASPEEVGVVEREPGTWLLLSLTGLLALKLLFVDPSTNLLRCTSTATAICGAAVTVDVPFAGGPRLRGYSLSGQTAMPGSSYQFRVFWQSDAPHPALLHSFAHIRNSEQGWPVNPRTGSEIWAQTEHMVPGGVLATEFRPGLIYQEEFSVPLPPDMPPGTYFLEIGWFDPATGEQLDPVHDAIQPPLRPLWRSLLLPSITVR